MQAQKRLVAVPTRQIALGAALVAAVALVALLTYALIVGRPHSQQLTPPSTHLAIAHALSPDAAERNAEFLLARATRFNNQSPDAQEREVALARALAAKFNNQSPDAQERNIQLSGG